MSDETIRAEARPTTNDPATLAEMQRKGLEGGRLYLAGHTSPETAYVQADYPYGFRGRCLRRAWIETKGKHGMRLVLQTSAPYYPSDGQSAPDPKAARWNKPKPETYSLIAVLYLDHLGHVHREDLGFHAGAADHAASSKASDEGRPYEADVDAFRERAVAAITDDVAKRLEAIRARRRAMSRVRFTCTSAPMSSDPGTAAREAAEAAAREEGDNRLIRALTANEGAAIRGEALPVPQLGTAAAPAGPSS